MTDPDDATRFEVPCAGELSLEEMKLVLRHLPSGISFANEDGVLRYFRGALFADCHGTWIGRHVNDCHAPSLRPMIDHIAEEFRAGRQDEAAFWKLKSGRLVLSRYIAVRDDDRSYRGILETFEDVTDLRCLEGQKETLDW